MIVMKKRYLLCLACCCSLLFSAAQETKRNKFKFQSLNSIGLINGDNATSAALQTVNGFSKGAFFAGIGVGLDYYRYRTIPLFADLRYEFGKKKTRPFLYADGGANFEWAQDEFLYETTIWNPGSNDFKHGIYMDMGIGLNAGLKNGNAIVLSLGYSRKTMKETTTYQDWRTQQMVTDINKYRFNRLILKMGFRFW
jgi:hypothetical protein